MRWPLRPRDAMAMMMLARPLSMIFCADLKRCGMRYGCPPIQIYAIYCRNHAAATPLLHHVRTATALPLPHHCHAEVLVPLALRYFVTTAHYSPRRIYHYSPRRIYHYSPRRIYDAWSFTTMPCCHSVIYHITRLPAEVR